MGIRELLRHLPGGKHYKYGFMDLGWKGKKVPIDAAGAMYQFASFHAADFLKNNHKPSLILFARWLVHLRSTCYWNLMIYFDGMENKAKEPAKERRQIRRDNAINTNNLRGQIRNTPEYIAKACEICKLLDIKFTVSAYEADPQVSYVCINEQLVPVTGDTDLLAYGAQSIVIVRSFSAQVYRIIDLNADVREGEYPLIDLYKKHGVIVFRLYAGVSGCDFTEAESGLVGIGYESFINAATKVGENLNANTLAAELWTQHQTTIVKAGFNTQSSVEMHLQRIVDVYAKGEVYDKEGNIRDMTGTMKVETNKISIEHMAGMTNSQTREPHSMELQTLLDSTNWSDCIHETNLANASNIRGVRLPEGKETLEDCIVQELRDYIGCRSGTMGGSRAELLATANAYKFFEEQATGLNYVDRYPDRSLFVDISTSGTIPVTDILKELEIKIDKFGETTQSLIQDIAALHRCGTFEDSYENISRIAPELKPEFIYKSFGHIGMSISEKNIGDALTRCFLTNKLMYHSIAMVPEQNKVYIISKCQASMKTDAKAKGKTDDSLPKKMEYFVMMEIFYTPTNNTNDKHDLGIFSRMGRTYCAACIGGNGDCRHLTQTLWYQHHHWTDERLGVDRPTTIDACAWAPGGKALCCDIRQPLSAQQTVKFEKTLEGQAAKMKRKAERDCTEGRSGQYEVHWSSKKQKRLPGRFAKGRVDGFLQSLRELYRTPLETLQYSASYNQNVYWRQHSCWRMIE